MIVNGYHSNKIIIVGNTKDYKIPTKNFNEHFDVWWLLMSW